MNLSAPFIKRPVATTLLTVALVLSGALAFFLLPVSALPQIDFPTISVQAQLPGASPEIMASSVATPLERQFGHIAGVNEMTSSSYLGTTSINLVFDLGRDINGAARDVQAAINAARSYLPSNLPSNPTYRKVNPADAPIMILALTSTVYDRGPLYDAASTIIQQRLLQIQGVGQVNVGGSSLPAVRVDVDPTALNNTGIGLPDVANLLHQQNANSPKGQFSDEHTTWDIVANDQLLRAADYRGLLLAYNKGAAFKLTDVASIEDSVQNIRATGYLNGEPAVLVIVFRSPGANIIDTVDRIREALPSLKASVPAAIGLTIVLDRTSTIRASVRDVEFTLLASVGLVILVVFIFLRNFRATLIPSVAVPASLIGTFGVMYLLNYSLDNLSLMALTISTGFVVDDAIVVIENITRYLEAGVRPLEAALRGAREIGFTVLSISISLVAVFIPLLMMGGIVGRLFREFAVTLSVAILVSLVLSLTTTPMMCSRLLKTNEKRSSSKLFALSERFFSGILKFYEKSLAHVLRHPALTLSALLLTIALNFYLLIIVPKGFFPEQDNGTIFGGIQGAQDISFQSMNGLTKTFVELIKTDPAVQNVMAFSGGSGATNSGFVYIELKPLDERGSMSSSQVINRLRPKLISQPGASVFLQAGQDVRIGGRQSSAQYQYTIQSENLEDLVKWGPLLYQQAKQLPGLTDVNTDQQNKGLEAWLTYDRASASRVGVSPMLLDQTLYNAFGQSLVSTMYTPLNQYYVVLEVVPRDWQSPEGLSAIYLHPPGGPVVPLDALTHYESRTAPLSVNHQGQYPSVTVSFNLAPGMALGDAAREISEMEQKIGLPATIHGMFSGTLEAFKESLATEPLLILTALLAVYIVLGILYESYVHPITILSTIPSAGVGAVLALMLFSTELSIVALIGMILLIGIVKKNAILMIDFALAAERGEGKSSKDAIFEACLLRFRPILMTTMAALFGAVPLAFGTGTGAELRRPLGIAIMGGLIVSQLLTLYTTPVVYLYLDRLRLWLKTAGAVKENTVIVASLFLLSVFPGCALVVPKYQPPKLELPATYKELAPNWKQAEPKDAELHGRWWKMFDDPRLDALEEQVMLSNQNIAAAVASLLQARALVKEARAGYFPSLSTTPSLTMQNAQATTTYQSLPKGRIFQYTAPLNASWVPDLWGRVQSTVKQATAAAQISAADLENVKLAAQTELATDYHELTNQDALLELYKASVDAYRKSLELTKALYATGIDSEEAVAQAENQLQTTQAQLTGLEIARAQYEHAIALLVGKPASAFSLSAMSTTAKPPQVPAGVPSSLVERRPDIAAAERAMAAANAQIGAGTAAFFPSVTLSGAVGIAGNSIVGLAAAPAFIWSLGASVFQTIFDGGLRAATVEQYKAAYEQTVATYRQTVLSAFAQVEDGLAGLRVLSTQSKEQELAVRSSERLLKLTTERYRLGIDPYLNVLSAQISLLSNRQSSLNLRLQQLTTSVQLIEALGGGWDTSKLPSE